MENRLRFAGVNTPTPSVEWIRSTESERLSRIAELMMVGDQDFQRWLSVISAKEDGQITVRFNQPLSPGDRGTLLLDFEAALKKVVDSGLVVWAESLGDKNTLRNLRGIEVRV
jgi:hypothetical protein